MIKLKTKDPRLESAKINLTNYSSNLLKFGMSDNPSDYSNEELLEIINGIYRVKKKLLVRGDYFINVEDIISAECNLDRVTYKKSNLSTKDYKDGYDKKIENVNTFHVRDYFVVTINKYGGEHKHNITNILFKAGLLKKSTGKSPRFFSIKNDYERLFDGVNPKDLFHPIKRFINGYFFENDYHVSEFKVTGSSVEFEQ